MRARIAITIFKKELRETLRDRRTLLVMIVLPIVLYPALLLLTMGLAGQRQEKLRETASKVALLGEREAGVRASLAGEKTLTIVDMAPVDGALPSAEALLSSKRADTVLELPEGTAVALGRGEVTRAILYVDDTRDTSRLAGRRVETALGAHKRLLVERALAARGLPAGIAEPMRIERRNVASAKRMGAFLVSQILPVLLISMLVMGAFYPAIDVTAGEKERATLETLMTSPVRPIEIVTGKFLAVLCISIIACVANVASMGATLAQMLSMMPGTQGAVFEVPLERLALIFVILVPLAVLASALTLAIAVLAQSFKEAQNLLTPALLVLIVPAAVGSMPGMELDAQLAVVPALNTSLLTKALLLGEASADMVFIVFASNAVFAGLALFFAARNFGSEAVLLGTGRPFHPRDLFRLGARPVGARPTPGGAFLFFALLFVVLWYGGQALQRWRPLEGVLLSQWLCIALPAIGYALARRYDLRATFRFRLPSKRGAAGVILCALGLPLLVLGATLIQETFLPVPAKLVEAMRHLMEDVRARAGEPALFATMALTPAICEELAFRGVLLDGFSRRSSKTWSIAVTAVLFGAFHGSLFRFFPTALAGAVLAYLVLETGSILSGMIAHATYNALLIGASLYLGENYVPPWWSFVIAAGVFGVGATLVRRSARSADEPARA